MTYRELLKDLRSEIQDDSELDDEVRFHDLLDWLACLGVEGAAKTYHDQLPTKHSHDFVAFSDGDLGVCACGRQGRAYHRPGRADLENGR